MVSSAMLDVYKRQGDGGALVNDRKSVVTISNVTATGNAASNRGGGLFLSLIHI